MCIKQIRPLEPKTPYPNAHIISYISIICTRAAQKLRDTSSNEPLATQQPVFQFNYKPLARARLLLRRDDDAAAHVATTTTTTFLKIALPRVAIRRARMKSRPKIAWRAWCVLGSDDDDEVFLLLSRLYVSLRIYGLIIRGTWAWCGAREISRNVMRARRFRTRRGDYQLRKFTARGFPRM